MNDIDGITEDEQLEAAIIAAELLIGRSIGYQARGDVASAARVFARVSETLQACV